MLPYHRGMQLLIPAVATLSNACSEHVPVPAGDASLASSHGLLHRHVGLYAAETSMAGQ